MPFLELHHICKTFCQDGAEISVLDDVNIEVEEGEFLCILGPTGCGKSVTMKIIAGLLEQTSGTVLLDGVEEHGASQDKGMIFQEYALLPWRTVRGNVEFGLELKGLATADCVRIADEYLRKAGLHGYADQRISEIPVGARQLVAIARALASDPKILLMDEPFDSLDVLTKEEMQIKLLDTWTKTKKTIVFVTHDVDEAILLSDRICVMDVNPGRVKEMLVNSLPRPRSELNRTGKDFLALREQIVDLYSSLKAEELDLII
jgi:NitT/TauT family transport system ATP-binding protein